MEVTGRLVISLDCESLLGMKDHNDKSTYGQNILGAREVIPRLLELFSQYDIHATWAFVGMLLAENKTELIKYIPKVLPTYINIKLSNYTYIDDVGENEETDPYNFAFSLVQKVLEYPKQEIGSHTFSHYYCRESGQTILQFNDDLAAAQLITNTKIHRHIRSLVFPKNQCHDDYINSLKEHGIYVYRGCEKHRFYDPNIKEILLKRACRLLDAYINLTGMHCYQRNELNEGGICNLRSSRFLRPYSSNLFFLEWLKMHRIKRQMKFAAKHNLIFHIWWHPHNFGINTEKNLKQLEELLQLYDSLNEKYEFRSCNMNELAEEILL